MCATTYSPGQRPELPGLRAVCSQVKFLVDRNGQPVKRFGPQYDPLKFEDDVRPLSTLGWRCLSAVDCQLSLQVGCMHGSLLAGYETPSDDLSGLAAHNFACSIISIDTVLTGQAPLYILLCVGQAAAGWQASAVGGVQEAARTTSRGPAVQRVQGACRGLTQFQAIFFGAAPVSTGRGGKRVLELRAAAEHGWI